eukprot:768045-Hanusia_phi.AAC.4
MEEVATNSSRRVAAPSSARAWCCSRAPEAGHRQPRLLLLLLLPLPSASSLPPPFLSELTSRSFLGVIASMREENRFFFSCTSSVLALKNPLSS